MQNMGKMEMGKMGAMSMGMSTVISWNTHCVVFLIPGTHAKNATQFFVGCFVVLLIAVFSQLLLLASFREAWIGGGNRKAEKNTSTIVFEVGNGTDSDRATNQEKISEAAQPKVKKQEIKDSKVWQITKIVLYYTFIALLSLLLMLIAMTMNGYIIISVALGTGIGKAIVMIRNESNARNIQEKTQKQQEIQKIQQYFCQM